MSSRTLGAVAIFSVLLAGPAWAQAPQADRPIPKPIDAIANLADLTWVKISPPAHNLRNETSMAWDRANLRAVVWGGHGAGYGGPQLHETWIFDPTKNTWTEVEPATSPPGACCVRDMRWDPVSGTTLTLTGHSNNHGWQLARGVSMRGGIPWAYDLRANTWTPMRPIGASGPGRRAFKGMAYDPDNQVMWVFAGESKRGDLWAYDSYLNTWTQHKQPDKLAQDKRRGPALWYDTAQKKLLMYGGIAPLTDTWSYDPATGRWEEMAAPNHPPEGSTPYAVFDSVNQAPLLITTRSRSAGGGVEVYRFDWTKKDWQRVQSKGAPEHYSYHLNGQAIFMQEYNAVLFCHSVKNSPADKGVGGATPFDVWAFRYKTPDKPVDLPLPGELWKSRPQPPHPETPVVSVKDARTVQVTWKPVTVGNVVGYNVYRIAADGQSDKEGHLFSKNNFREPVKLTEKPVEATRFVDSSIDLTRPNGGDYKLAVFLYAVKAVNAGGIESGFSPYAETVPDIIRNVRTKVSGNTVTVNWDPAPEQHLRGYQVYRMDKSEGGGRVYALPLREPVTETRFVDTLDRPHVCRYYVVAVDALGQWGIPSSGQFAAPAPN